MITDYNVVIQQEKDIFFNSLRETNLDDDIKSVIFEFVKPPLTHLKASFYYKHKKTGMIIYKDTAKEDKFKNIVQNYTLSVTEKCDNCFEFFNQIKQVSCSRNNFI